MTKIGILGGTFDPIHFGHLRLAQELLDTLKLAEVWFMPTANPPHRDQPAASASHRANMVSLAIADNPRFKLDTGELVRDGVSYTVDTLLSLRQTLGHQQSLCLLMGSDAFLGLPGWHRWQELLSLCHIVVAHRPHAEPDLTIMQPPLRALLEHTISRDVADLSQKAAGRIFMQHITPLDIAATAIREDLQQKNSPRYLLPACVLDYIHVQQLYD